MKESKYEHLLRTRLYILFEASCIGPDIPAYWRVEMESRRPVTIYATTSPLTWFYVSNNILTPLF